VVTGVNSYSHDFDLAGNFPNPASEVSNISYSLNVAASVKIEIMNMDGEIIQSLIQQEQTPGIYWIPVNTLGFQPGVYVYRFISNNFVDTGRLTIIKRKSFFKVVI
jgi:hypothetical protein